jgi:5-oxoprolinase (ATP-hydrolysing)
MHSYRYPAHETEIATIAKEIGLTQVSVSHKVSPLMKLVSRGDTTVVDAYLSPILRRYVEQVSSQLVSVGAIHELPLQFMQSNGGLVDAQVFQGKDSIYQGQPEALLGQCRLA